MRCIPASGMGRVGAEIKHVSVKDILGCEPLSSKKWTLWLMTICLALGSHTMATGVFTWSHVLSFLGVRVEFPQVSILNEGQGVATKDVKAIHRWRWWNHTSNGVVFLSALEHVHSDLCGPMHTASHSGALYTTFIDNHTCYGWVYFLCHPK